MLGATVEGKAVSGAEGGGVDRQDRTGGDGRLVGRQLVVEAGTKDERLEIRDRARGKGEPGRIVACEVERVGAKSGIEAVRRVERRAQTEDVVAGEAGGGIVAPWERSKVSATSVPAIVSSPAVPVKFIGSSPHIESPSLTAV